MATVPSPAQSSTAQSSTAHDSASAQHPSGPASSESERLAPGVTIECRDELWLITQATRVSDGWRLRVRGLSDFVRDTTATLFTALDPDMRVFDPTKVTVQPDTSPRFRQTSLWVESILRSTPVPLYQESLEVADRLLLDPWNISSTPSARHSTLRARAHASSLPTPWASGKPWKLA